MTLFSNGQIFSSSASQICFDGYRLRVAERCAEHNHLANFSMMSLDEISDKCIQGVVENNLIRRQLFQTYWPNVSQWHPVLIFVCVIVFTTSLIIGSRGFLSWLDSNNEGDVTFGGLPN